MSQPSHYHYSVSHNSQKDERELHTVRANMLTINAEICSLCKPTLTKLQGVTPYQINKTCKRLGCTN
jgi:hypothetical protein